MITRRYRSIREGAHFLFANLQSFSGLPPFSERSLQEGIVIRACKSCEVRQVVALRKQLYGNGFSWVIRLLLRLIPEKCCVVVSDERGALRALSCFYFNEIDIRDATIHEGFIGVRPEFAGKGIATSIRQFSADHFSTLGTLRGISSRITLSNAASAASGAKVGYELVEAYKDEVTGEDRGYFISRLSREARA